MTDRRVVLEIAGEENSEEFEVNMRISQESLIFLVLFDSYITDLFDEIELLFLFKSVL